MPKSQPNSKLAWVVPVVEGKVKQDDATLQFVDSVLADLRALMMSTVGLFRWRHGIAEGPPEPCHTLKACYSEDGKVWREILLARSIKIRFGMSYWGTLDNDICKQVVELATAGMEEPLGRQLFREAWSQKGSHPRSALVIGVAAAEVGFKNSWAP